METRKKDFGKKEKEKNGIQMLKKKQIKKI